MNCDRCMEPVDSDEDMAHVFFNGRTYHICPWCQTVLYHWFKMEEDRYEEDKK